MPDSYHIEVTPPQLRELAAQIEVAANRITQELSSVQTQIRGLSHEVFDGHTAERYLSEYAASARHFEAMPGQLRSFAVQLRAAADKFEAMDGRLAGSGSRSRGERPSLFENPEPGQPNPLSYTPNNAWLNKDFNAQFVWDHIGFLGTTVEWGLKHNQQLGKAMHGLLSTMDSWIPGGDTVGRALYIKGAGLAPDIFYNHEYILGGVRTLGAGLTDGLIDYAVGGEYNVEELATQVGSGLLQAVVLGPNVQFVNAGVQVFGNLASNVIEGNADWLAMGDAVRATEIVASADQFQAALETVSLDNIADNTVNAVFSGDFERLGTDFVGYAESGWTVVSEGADLTRYAIEGVADQIAANTYIDETINEVASGIGNAAQDFWNSLGNL